MVNPENNEKSNETFGDSLVGTYNAIKQYVQANKEGGQPTEDKKKSILKKLLKK